MPNLDGGDIGRATAKMRANVELLAPWAERGVAIVTPGPTCGYTIKKEWAEYVPTDEARSVAASTVDLMEFFDGFAPREEAPRRGSPRVGSNWVPRGVSPPCPEDRNSRRPSARDSAGHRRPGGRALLSRRWHLGDEGSVLRRRRAIRCPDGRRTLCVGPGTLVVGDCSLAGQRMLGASGLTMHHPAVAFATALGLVDGPRLERFGGRGSQPGWRR